MSNIPDDDDMPCLIASSDADELDNLSKEERIEHAITAIHQAGGDLSLRKAAKAYNVPHSTLQARFDGRKSRVESHAHEQNLSPAQEQILVDWVKVQGQRGIPLSLASVTDYASDIAGKPMGDSWIRRFRSR